MSDAMTGFFARTYRTTAWVGAVVAVALWATLDWQRAVAFLVGAGISVIFLAGVVTTVEALARPPAERRGPRWPYSLLYLGKYAVAVGGLYLLARWSPDLLPYAAPGIALPLAVMGLKAAGMELNRRIGVDDGAEQRKAASGPGRENPGSEGRS